MQQSASEVLKDIKQKKLAPIYLLHGDEPYPVSYTHLTLPTNREV